MATTGIKRWLVNLLENEKAVTSLLKFLKITKIGERERENKKKREWAKKHDQKDENLLE